MSNIMKIQLGSDELRPGHRYSVCVHRELDLGDLTLSQDYDTPLGHGRQLCEILFRSNVSVKSYCPDTDVLYACNGIIDYIILGY